MIARWIALCAYALLLSSFLLITIPHPTVAETEIERGTETETERQTSVRESELFLSHSRHSLAPSTWPVDHGDTARSKFVLGGARVGLPANVSEHEIRVLVNDQLQNAQWLYTAGDDSQFLFVIHGTVGNFLLSKLDSVSLVEIQRFRFLGGMYTGGLLAHRNGHIYAVYSNRLYMFQDGDLEKVTWVDIPTTLNEGIVQTNGMLVTQDGYLVIKQWPWTFQEFTMTFLSQQTFITKILVTIFLISFSVVMFIKTKAGHSYISNILTSIFYAVIITFFLVNVVFIANFQRALGKSHNVGRYFAEGLFSKNGGGGQLKLVDPMTLEVKANIDLPERCSFARMALSKTINSEGDSEDAIILLGDENVFQVRWSPKSEKLYWIKDWSRRYRKSGQGSFPGTGPSIYNETTYFTDNTFPVMLGQRSYSMFSLKLNEIESPSGEKRKVAAFDYLPSEEVHFPSSNTIEHYTNINNDFRELPKISLVTNGSEIAGFMFWSVTIHPETTDGGIGHAMVWDSAGRTVQARDLNDVANVHWTIHDIIQADCITSLPDKGHIYMTDYDFGPEKTNEWLSALSGSVKKYTQSTKYFLVIDGDTGKELVRKALPTKGINPSLLVPGANNDVFLGGQKGITRLYV